MDNAILEAMVDAALAAGRRIAEIYARDFSSAAKADGTPVTIADHEAEAIIEKILAPFDLPILGEERVASGAIPKLGDRFFCVDPLDGTKEFIKRNGEFTVNIGLVENGRAVAGVILAPARGKIWIGGPGGANMAEVHGIGAYERRTIAVQTSRPPKVVASRSHGHAALETLMQAFGATENLSVGSALKFCLVAEGTAQLYPRLTPTAEWDTAAGQAILEAAGGAMLSIDGEPMRYGKRLDSFINPMFVAASDLALARACAAKMHALA